MSSAKIRFTCRPRSRVFRGRANSLLRLLLLLSINACSISPGLDIPPVNHPPTADYIPGKIVWHDLLTDDPVGVRRFYGELLGWTFDTGSGYTTILNGARPIGGIVSLDSADKHIRRGRWLISLSVSNVDEAAEFVRTHGGVIHETPQQVGQRGRMAVVSGPQDAQLVLLHSGSGDPADRPPRDHDWLWNELWTQDASAAEEFYSLLGGYTVGQVEDKSGQTYDVLKRDGRPRIGIAQLKNPDIQSAWVPYIRVRDPARLTRRVIELGGRVLLPPTADFENGSIAIVADPDGGVFGLQKWAGQAD